MHMNYAHVITTGVDNMGAGSPSRVIASVELATAGVRLGLRLLSKTIGANCGV
jgi:hypothetical protein